MRESAAQAKVPKGYRQTEVGLIPEDWICCRVGEVIDLLTGFPFASSGYSDNGVLLVRGSNVKRGYLDWDEELTKYWPAITTDIARYELRPRDIVIAMDGALVGHSYAVISASDIPSLLLQRVARIRSAKLDVGFLVFWIASDHFVRHVDSVKTHTAIPHMSPADIRSFCVAAPSDALEQRAIAEALSDVDGLIGALEALIAKKRAIKQAAMQQLLTGKTRLPGFTGKWETKRLSELSTIAMGRTPSRSNAKFWGRGHVWLSIADLQGKVVDESKEQITDLAAATMTPIPKGTLLMSFKLSIGRLCFAGCDLFTNEAICSFTDLQADADYLYYALGRTDFALYGKQAVKGYTLNSESLKLVEVTLPGSAEQTAIAAVLSDMDAEIAVLERRRDKTKQIKQGMMQQLLTGRIRLVKPEAPAVQTATERKGTEGHNWAFNEAVVISTLTKHFGSERFPLGRMRYTKLSYLLHRHVEKQTEGYLKKAAGPYNPKTRYGGPERIAVENGYVREHKSGPYSGFVAGDNVAQAEGYFEKWYGPECLQWLERFRRRKNEELELLATVDMAAEELRAAGKDVDVDGVKAVIGSHPEWQAKLDRPIFSDASITRAIETCHTLFQTPEDDSHG